MRKILIVDPDEAFRKELGNAFHREFQVHSCGDGAEGLELLRTLRPDILILSLFLPKMDGLFFLEEAGALRPPLILCTTVSAPDYVLNTVQDLGVSYVVLKPCLIRAVVNRIRDMLQKEARRFPENPRTIIEKQLDLLGYDSTRDGYKHLRAGVPLFAQDPYQKLSHDLYLSISRICGARSPGSVEFSIRSATEEAWEHGNRALWQESFPNHTKAPSNKELLLWLAKLLDVQ